MVMLKLQLLVCYSNYEYQYDSFKQKLVVFLMIQ